MTTPQSDIRRKAYALARRVGFDRQERMEFAVALLGLEVTSWDELGEAQIERVADGLCGLVFGKLILEHEDHGRVKVA